MVILRSGSVTSSDTSDMAELSSDQFSLFLVEACKQPDIQQLLKNIVIGDKELFADVISAEVYRQTQPLRQQLQEKDHEIGVLRQHIEDQWPLLLTWFNFNPSMDK